MRAVGDSAIERIMKLQTLTLHGNRVAYLDEGAGDVLLLIHGIGGSSDCWRDVVLQAVDAVPRHRR